MPDTRVKSPVLTLKRLYINVPANKHPSKEMPDRIQSAQ